MRNHVSFTQRISISFSLMRSRTDVILLQMDLALNNPIFEVVTILGLWVYITFFELYSIFRWSLLISFCMCSQSHELAVWFDLPTVWSFTKQLLHVCLVLSAFTVQAADRWLSAQNRHVADSDLAGQFLDIWPIFWQWKHCLIKILSFTGSGGQ